MPEPLWVNFQLDPLFLRIKFMLLSQTIVLSLSLLPSFLLLLAIGTSSLIISCLEHIIYNLNRTINSVNLTFSVSPFYSNS